jgi:hypothetical protein
MSPCGLVHGRVSEYNENWSSSNATYWGAAWWSFKCLYGPWAYKFSFRSQRRSLRGGIRQVKWTVSYCGKPWRLPLFLYFYAHRSWFAYCGWLDGVFLAFVCRFAQFYISPLFSADAVSREIRAVDSGWFTSNFFMILIVRLSQICCKLQFLSRKLS